MNNYHNNNDAVNKYRRNRRNGPRIINEFMMMYLSCVIVGSSVVMGFAPSSRYDSFQTNRIRAGQRDYLHSAAHTSMLSRNKLALHSSLNDDDGDDNNDGRKYGNRNRRTPNRPGKKGLKGKRFHLTRAVRDSNYVIKTFSGG